MDPILIEQLIAAVIALISVIVAIFKDSQAKTALETAENAGIDKEIAEARMVYAQGQTQEVQDFFDPDSPVTTPPSGTPTRSYVMRDSVRAFLICGESASDQAVMLDQVNRAEAAGEIRYVVKYSKGYYEIEYGQITGGAKSE